MGIEFGFDSRARTGRRSLVASRSSAKSELMKDDPDYRPRSARPQAISTPLRRSRLLLLADLLDDDGEIARHRRQNGRQPLRLTVEQEHQL